MKEIIQFFDTYCFSHFRNDTLSERLMNLNA